MRFSVCIPSIRPDTLAAAITSIIRQTWHSWDLIIISQGERAAMEAVVKTASQGDPRIKFLHLDRRGVSKARNAGIQATSGEIVAFMDDDCEAQPDWLATLAEYFERDSDIGLVAGSLVALPPQRRGFSVCPAICSVETVYDPVASNRKAPQGWGWMGANFSVRRAVIARVGLFDEYLGPGAEFPAAEDTDYLLRLEELGVKMATTPRAVVNHTHGRRYGLQAVYKHARNYATGDGGCAAKLTLCGDVRGEEWKRHNWCGVVDLLRSLRLPEFTIRLLRYWYFIRAYQNCLRSYRVDSNTNLLGPANPILPALEAN